MLAASEGVGWLAGWLAAVPWPGCGWPLAAGAAARGAEAQARCLLPSPQGFFTREDEGADEEPAAGSEGAESSGEEEEEEEAAGAEVRSGSDEEELGSDAIDSGGEVRGACAAGGLGLAAGAGLGWAWRVAGEEACSAAVLALQPLLAPTRTRALLPSLRQDDEEEGSESEGASSSGGEEGGESGDESDGYGEEGLSWEAVMASVQVSKGF